MMLATYPTRLIPLVALSGRRLPDDLVRWLRYVPVAVFSALVFPGLLVRNGTVDPTPLNPQLWAGFATFVLALATRSLAKSVLAGIGVALLGELVLI